MNDQYAARALLLIAGASLLVYAPSAAPPSGTFLTLEGPVSRGELPADANVIGYEDLSADMKENFENALEKDEVPLDGSVPNRFGKSGPEYVHYRDAYYEVGFVAVDSPGLGHVLVTAGFGCILLVAGIGAALEGRRKSNGT